MKFVSRLIILVAVVLVAFGGVSAIGLQIIRQTTEVNDLASAFERLSAHTWRVRGLTYEIQVTSRLSEVIPDWLEAAEKLPAQVGEITELPQTSRIADQSEEFATVLNRLATLKRLVQPELNAFRRSLGEITNDFTDYPNFTLELERQRNPRAVYSQVQTRGEVVASYLDNELQTLLDTALQELRQFRIDIVGLLLGVFFGVVAVATTLVVILILVFLRSLHRRFNAIARSMDEITAGDLTVEVQLHGRDEVAGLSSHVQTFVGEFSRVVTDIQEIVHAASVMRADLLAATEESSAAVTEIGGNVRSITGVIEDLDSTIEGTSRRVHDINKSIEELESSIGEQNTAVAESSAAVHQMSEGIAAVARLAADRAGASERLRDVAGNAQAKVGETDARIHEIALAVGEVLEIISVINAIADQTGILSMNAAIEAAHAGDLGKGFAVVAEEIRKLSESTTENAMRVEAQLRRASELTGETQATSDVTRETLDAVETEVGATATVLEEISATVRELAEGTKSVLSGTEKVGELTSSIHSDAVAVSHRSAEITGSMEHVRDISASVRGGMEEISVGTTEIGDMMQHLSTVTRDVTDEIDRLGNSVARFHTLKVELHEKDLDVAAAEAER